jgi:hypothetical protein
MSNCTVLTKSGEQCKLAGKPEFTGLCTRHHNMKMRTDEAYRTAFQARVDAENAAQLAREERARVAREAEREAVRAQKIARRDRALEEIPTLSIHKVLEYARRAMEIWDKYRIPEYDIPKAYGALIYRSPTNPGFQPLLRAIIRLRFLDNSHHPDANWYRDVPQAERDEVNAAIRTALEPYLPLNPVSVIKEQTIVEYVNVRVRQEEAERRRLEAIRAEELAREAAIARHAQFQADLRERPVVFQRDPSGGIDLRAFAADTQSVHRSSVQESTHKAVIALMARPILEGVEVLSEVVESFGDPRVVTWRFPENKEKVVTEVTNDYFNTMAFETPYGAVVDRVWAFIRGHVHRNEMVIRLAEEVYEGRGMCSNGKMARLVNVLQGFDETLETEAPREVFQFRMAALRKLPMAERTAAARAIFAEFKIPEAEHEAWLDPLLEDDEPAPVPTAAGGAAANVLVHE